MAIKYTSFVADPNIVTGQQLQDYGITTLPEYQATGGSPYLLGQVDEGIQYQTPSYDKYSDLYQY